MGLFDLPSGWVYVEYEDGTKENVANTDSINEKFAKSLADNWSKARKKKVVRVYLERNDKFVVGYVFGKVKAK